MSLNSNSLCGLVLLVPKRIRLTTDDIKESKIIRFIVCLCDKYIFFLLCFKEFAFVCERSTDFHFPSLEQQLSSIEDCVQQANKTRSAVSGNGDSQSIASKHNDSCLEVSQNNSDEKMEKHVSKKPRLLIE